MPIDLRATSSKPDKDENSYLNPSLRGAQPIFGWTTW